MAAKDERSRKGINSNDCTSNIEAASFPEPETFNTSNAKGVKDTPLGFSHQKNDIATDVQRNIKDEASHLTEARQTIFKNLLSWRYFMVLLLQTSFVVTVFLRQCMPMALVCMVRPPKTAVSSNHSDLPRTVFNNRTYANVHKDTSDQVSVYEFDWDPTTEGLILTSSALLSFIGPMLADGFRELMGNKLSLTLTIAISALLTLISPVAARTSPYFLIAVRTLLGITLRGNAPVVSDTLAWWSPQAEKLTIIAVVYSGVNVGGIVNSFLAGYLCTVPADNGWPFVFYTFGTVALLWCVVWYFLSSQKPEDHQFVSEKEKAFIVSHRTGMDNLGKGKRSKPPYRKILLSVPVAACIASASCHMWTTTIILTYLPKYFNKLLQFSVQETGMLVSLMSACRMLGSFFWTIVGNKIMTKYGTNLSRKICVGIGFTLAGASQICVAFFGNSDRWVVAGMIICVMINQAVGSSVLMALPLDMAPRYAGFISGLMTSIASFVNLSGPLMTAAITSQGTKEEWRIVWTVMAAVFFTAAIIFTLFGQASLQPWALAPQSDLPHVIPPLVTLGRRFTETIEVLPHILITPNIDGGLEAGSDVYMQTHLTASAIPGGNRTLVGTNRSDENYRSSTPHNENGTNIGITRSDVIYLQPHSSSNQTVEQEYDDPLSSLSRLADQKLKQESEVKHSAFENRAFEIHQEVHSSKTNEYINVRL